MRKNRIITAVLIAAAMLVGCGSESASGSSAETAAVSSDMPADKISDSTRENGIGFTVTAVPDGEMLSAPEKSVTTVEKNTGYTSADKDKKKKSSSAEKKSETSAEDHGNDDSGTKENVTGKNRKNTSSSASADISLELSSVNSWENGSDKFVQIDAVVRNNGSSTVNGWTASVTADPSTAVEQYWNCEITVKKGVLTITPVEWNTNVEGGRDVTFGVILRNCGDIDPERASLAAGAVTVGGTAASGGNNGGNSNNSGNNGNNNNTGLRSDIPEPSSDDWLSVKGNRIVDSKGKTVWLTGVNWFGYNTGTNTFDGLWTCDLNTSITAIADHGFNLLRIPISAELIKNWSEGNYPTANFNQATNSYLVGMNSLEIFDYVVDSCRAEGIKIMIDIHSAKTDASGHMTNVWYSGNISEKDYLSALGWIAGRYKNDDAIIAYDLKNEPHGKANESPRAKWDGSKDSDNWKYIAEKAANAVLSENPNVLIMVEGIEIYPVDIKKNGDFSSKDMGDYHCTWWGGNLRGVKDNPVDLGKYKNKLVYSPHDYGPTVYEQPWFKENYDYNSLYRDAWHDNWLYITEDGTAPLLVGEWGGFMREPNLKWMKYFRQLIKEYHLSHTFWCFNANSGDTGGLVKDDFTTWDKEKYDFVKEVLWQQDGKFVGLDHKIPLGDNGITLSEAKKAY